MVPPAPARAGTDDGWTGVEPPALLYPHVIDWFHGWLVPMYRRPVGDGRSLAWCPQWWRHPEAVVRLCALWRGFEQRRTEPGDSRSAWLRDHLDHHMHILNDPAGPLRGCSDDRGHGSVTALNAWKMAEPPAGLTVYLGERLGSSAGVRMNPGARAPTHTWPKRSALTPSHVIGPWRYRTER